jgi:hypothetical protein
MWNVDTLGAAEPSWWMTRPWRRYLLDLLLYRSRRRYTLTVSEFAHAIMRTCAQTKSGLRHQSHLLGQQPPDKAEGM